MKRKIISLLLAAALSISCALPTMASSADIQELNANQSSPSTIGEEVPNSSNAVQYLWKIAFKAAKWVLVKADSALFNRDPQLIDNGGNWVASSSGDVTFGNGNDDIRRVKFTTNVSTAYNHLDVFAQAPITGWLDTITIFIEDSSGTEVYGGQVTHNQHILTSYNIPLDTYTIYYVDSDSGKWDCWIYRYDFTADYTRNATPSDTAYSSDVVYNPDTQKSYIIPSDALSPKNGTAKSSNSLTAQNLVDEFYDSQKNCSVNRMKNYNIGDTIYVSDVVTNLKYDTETNVSTVYFGNTTEGSFAWPFAGDLRTQINVNDTLTFKFKVVEEYATGDYSFETLDYFLESYNLIENGSAANIDNYLVR